MVSNKNLNDLYQLFSILHQYVSAGVNPEEGIALYAKDESLRPKMRKVLDGVLHDLKNGNDLAVAMSKHPSFFPNYIVEMMRVNTKTGQADAIYESVEQSLEEEIDLRRSIGSEVWPILVLLVALLIGYCVAVFFILPTMSNMLSDLHVEMPLISRFFLDVSATLQVYWFIPAGFFLAIVAAILYIRARQPELFAKMILHLPFYKEIVYYRLQYQFSHILGLCVEAGVETTHALQYTAMAVDNILMQNMLQRTVTLINRSGTELVTALKKNNQDQILDVSFYTMLKAAEAGNMDRILENRAKYFKKQLVIVSKMFGAKLSASIITPGFVVLIVIFVACYLPVFSLMTSFTSKGGGLM